MSGSAMDTVVQVVVSADAALGERFGVALKNIEAMNETLSKVERNQAQQEPAVKAGETADEMEALVRTAVEELDLEQKAPAALAELQLAYGKALVNVLRTQGAKADDAANETMFGPSIPSVMAVGSKEEEEEEEEDDDGEEDAESEGSEGSGEEEEEEEANGQKMGEKAETADEIAESSRRDEAGTEDGLVVKKPVEAEAGAQDGGDADGNQDLFELVWEQLECARVAFEKLGMELRLADTYETLGNFSMENDSFGSAARDFDAAKDIHARVSGADSLAVIGLLHSKYLALRRDQAEDALIALKLAASTFAARIERESASADADPKKLQGDREVLRDMQEEVEVFDAAIEALKNSALSSMLGGGAHVPSASSTAAPATSIGFGSASAAANSATKVVQVQPKKKRVAAEEVMFPSFDVKKSKVSPQSDVKSAEPQKE